MLQKQIRNIVVLLSILAVAFPAQAKKPTDPDDLFNPLLGPDYSHWMVGPLVEMATEDEVEAFLLLVSDEDARTFVERFWDARNAGAEVFTKTPQQIYEARAEDADKRFTEGAYPG
ncbi:MAG: GWxTD domain-containing protein, partial [Acidobacteriota bacterium]